MGISRTALLIALAMTCACQSLHQGEITMREGLLIKEQQTTPLYQNRQSWMADVRAEDEQLVPLIDHLEREEWDEAIVSARALLKKQPFHHGALVVVAAAQLEKGAYDQAGYYARLVLGRNPKHDAALNVLGLARYRLAQVPADYRAAEGAFRSAFEGTKAAVAPGLNLGYLQLERSNATLAAKTFQEVSRRCGGCDEALFGEAVARGRLGQHGQERELLETLISQNPQHLTGRYRLALYFHNVKNDREESLRVLAPLLEADEASELEVVEKAQKLWYANQQEKS